MYSFPTHETTATLKGVECRVEIARDCPFFAGHFPGNPVLPAIAHLQLVTEVYRAGKQIAVYLSSVDQLRMNARVGADETVFVRIANPSPDGKSRFRVERDGNVVSQGIVTWSEG
jgi:3-hydroxyacyl-[acyl-carrier-protein] dehydratase